MTSPKDFINRKKRFKIKNFSELVNLDCIDEVEKYFENWSEYVEKIK